MSKFVFPAVFSPEDGMYNVSFPDLPACYTCGDNVADALYMAEDALGGYLSRAEEQGTKIPACSDIPNVACPSDSFVSLVLVDTDAYRRLHSSRSVKKTLTIPEWLNTAAEERSINFSQVLQEALKERLGFTS